MRDTFRSTMPRVRRWGASLLTTLLLVAVTAGPASADEARVKFLADKLKSDDFRVRTNAALALGATNEDLAVDPLCGALSDSSEVVRQASAVALKRLNRQSSVPCLKARAEVETNEGVKIQISRALDALGSSGDSGGSGGGGGDEKIKENPAAKYYIALSSVANSTGRPQTEVEGIVMKAIKSKLDAAGTVQLAPSKETPDDAKKKMSERKMKGLYLAIAVDRFDYSSGNLRVKIKLGVFTYPGKSLVGNVDKGVTKEGVSATDKASEDQLLELAASFASEQVAQNASAFF